MINKIKEGDMVEYKYFTGHLFRTFGLVERVEKDKVWVQWLWTESPQGEMAEPKNQPRQNNVISYAKDKEGGALQLILVG
jgi:hypothetical protein